MKNKILTWLALSVIFCLSSFETKAQSVYIQDIIEYIDKNGQEFDALIGVRGIRYTEPESPESDGTRRRLHRDEGNELHVCRIRRRGTSLQAAS